MSLEKLSETLQGVTWAWQHLDKWHRVLEIVKFREMIEQRIQDQEDPLQTIPEEHLPLIAKLGHERWLIARRY